MLESLEYLHLTQEAVDALLRDGTQEHDFHGQAILWRGAASQIHRRRCSVAKLATNRVTAGEMKLDCFEQIKAGHDYRKAGQTRSVPQRS